MASWVMFVCVSSQARGKYWDFLQCTSVYFSVSSACTVLRVGPLSPYRGHIPLGGRRLSTSSGITVPSFCYFKWVSRVNDLRLGLERVIATISFGLSTSWSTHCTPVFCVDRRCWKWRCIIQFSVYFSPLVVAENKECYFFHFSVPESPQNLLLFGFYSQCTGQHRALFYWSP